MFGEVLGEKIKETKDGKCPRALRELKHRTDELRDVQSGIRGMEDGRITKYFERTPWLNLAGKDQYV